MASSSTDTTAAAAAPDSAQVERVVLDALRSMASVDIEVTREVELAALDIDSLDLVELTQILEEEHGVDLGLTGVKDVSTVGEVLDVILQRLGTVR